MIKNLLFLGLVLSSQSNVAAHTKQRIDAIYLEENKELVVVYKNRLKELFSIRNKKIPQSPNLLSGGLNEVLRSVPDNEVCRTQWGVNQEDFHVIKRFTIAFNKKNVKNGYSVIFQGAKENRLLAYLYFQFQDFDETYSDHEFAVNLHCLNITELFDDNKITISVFALAYSNDFLTFVKQILDSGIIIKNIMVNDMVFSHNQKGLKTIFYDPETVNRDILPLQSITIEASNEGQLFRIHS